MEKTVQKKRFSEEEALEKIEKNIDQKMEKVMKQSFITSFLHRKYITMILRSHFVEDINVKLQWWLRLFFSIVWRISLISGIIGVFWFLVSLSWLKFMFSLWFAIWFRVLVYVIFSLAFSLLSSMIWIGLIRHKKWVVSIIVLWLFISLCLFVISLIPVWLYSYASYGSIWSGLFNLIVTFVLFVLVVKNQEMFKR